METKYEKVISIKVSERKTKKYVASVKNKSTQKIRLVHFGGYGYEQYKDITGIGEFSDSNHKNTKRRKAYFSRHSAGITKKSEAIKYEISKSNGIINAKILSHKYLW